MIDPRIEQDVKELIGDHTLYVSLKSPAVGDCCKAGPFVCLFSFEMRGHLKTRRKPLPNDNLLPHEELDSAINLWQDF